MSKLFFCQPTAKSSMLCLLPCTSQIPDAPFLVPIPPWAAHSHSPWGVHTPMAWWDSLAAGAPRTYTWASPSGLMAVWCPVGFPTSVSVGSRFWREEHVAQWMKTPTPLSPRTRADPDFESLLVQTESQWLANIFLILWLVYPEITLYFLKFMLADKAYVMGLKDEYFPSSRHA